MSVLKKYAVFTGRSNRREFWMFVLINIIISVVLSFIDSGLGLRFGGAYGILSSLYFLFVLLPSLGVSIRRLHDINKSGWNILLALIPLVGAIILIIFYAKEGDSGKNQYGEPMKAMA